jgi:hypothetical protein
MNLPTAASATSATTFLVQIVSASNSMKPCTRMHPATICTVLATAYAAVLELLEAGSFGASDTAYGLTKLLLCWHDNRPINRLLAFLNTLIVIV